MTTPSTRFNELDLLAVLAKAEPSPGTLIDVGAHIGSFSVAFAEIGWQVIAFEAAPEIFEELRQRTAELPSVEAVWAAVTDEPVDSVDFYLSDAHWGIHSLRPFHGSHRNRTQVPAMRLADAVAARDLRDPIYLKCDAEGADLAVMRSFDFSAARPALVMCEFMDNRSLPHFGYAHGDLIREMARWEYVAYISEWSPVSEYSRRGVETAAPQHLNIWRSDVSHAPAWGNLIFVPKGSEQHFEESVMEHLAEVRTAADRALHEHDRVAKWAENAAATITNREVKIENLEASLTRARDRIAELDAAILQRDARAAHQLETIERLKKKLAAQSALAPASRSRRP